MIPYFEKNYNTFVRIYVKKRKFSKMKTILKSIDIRTRLLYNNRVKYNRKVYFMKRTICLVLLLLFILPVLGGCGGNAPDTDTLSVVAVTFSEYDWTKNVIGEKDGITLTLLVENGADLHSYQPLASDIVKIATCDILIYTGGASSTWIDEAVKNNPSEKRKTIRLMDLMTDEEKIHEQALHHNAEHEHNDVPDEHIWLSLRLASRFCTAIRDALCEKMPEAKDDFYESCESYVSRLKLLDEAFSKTVTEADRTNLLFADRFPFSYFAKDYGLTCYAAFPGCSAETEAGFETIAYLSERCQALSLPAIVVLEGSDHAFAETVKNTSGQKQLSIVEMNSLQFVSRKQIRDGISYLELMNANLVALRAALGCEDLT